MSLPQTSSRIILSKRPPLGGAIVPSGPDRTFATETVPLPPLDSLKEGEVLVEVLSLSLDPAMRGWLDDARSYIKPVQVGEVMRAYGVGRVVAGRPAKDERSQPLKINDIVTGIFGWQEYAIMSSSSIVKRSLLPGMVLSDWLGVLGPSGITAAVGMLEIAKLKEGETVVVSGAAGSVGIVACQIAKIYNCKTIAIAGSDEKCRWLKEDLGMDEALNYKDKEYKNKFKSAVGYLNVMFDNVGGEILNIALTRLQPFARIAFCGAIADYNQKPTGPSNYKTLISQRATLQGFIVFDHVESWPHYETLLSTWVSEGKIKRQETWVDGLEKAPEALLGLFEGKNTGKMLCRVKDFKFDGAEVSKL